MLTAMVVLLTLLSSSDEEVERRRRVSRIAEGHASGGLEAVRRELDGVAIDAFRIAEALYLRTEGEEDGPAARCWEDFVEVALERPGSSQLERVLLEWSVDAESVARLRTGRRELARIEEASPTRGTEDPRQRWADLQAFPCYFELCLAASRGFEAEGRTALATELADRARDFAEEWGWPHGEVEAQDRRGALFLAAGQLDEAHRAYRAAARQVVAFELEPWLVRSELWIQPAFRRRDLASLVELSGPLRRLARSRGGELFFSVDVAEAELLQSTEHSARIVELLPRRLAKDLGADASATPLRIAGARLMLGTALRHRGRAAEACVHLRAALRGFEELGDEATARVSMGNLANAMRDAGDVDGARELYVEIEARARRAGDLAAEFRAVEAQGNLCVQQDRFLEALERLERAAALAERMDRDDARTTAACNLCGLFFRLRLHDEVAGQLQRALAFSQELGDPRLRLSVGLHEAHLRLVQGDTAQAFDIAAALVDRAAALRLPAIRSTAVQLQAEAARRRGMLEVCARLLEEEGQPVVEADAHWLLLIGGLLELDRGAAAAAHVRFREFLARSQELGSREGWSQVHALLARASLELGELERARGEIREALLEGRRNYVGLAEREWIGHGIEASSAVEIAVAVARAARRTGEASPRAELDAELFEWLEAGRAQALLQSASKPSLPSDGSDDSEASDEHEAERREAELAERCIAALRRHRRDPGPGSEAALSVRYREWERQRSRLQRARGGGSELRPCRPLSEVQQGLSSSTALLLYHMPRRGSAGVLVVRSQSLGWHDLAEVDGIREAIERFNELASSPHFDDGPLASRLFDQLLGPLRADLEGVQELRISPQGVLGEFPFEAARDRERELRATQCWEISYVPSASLVLSPASPSGPSFVGMGAPERTEGLAALPGSAEELRRVAERFPDSLRLLGPRASLESWRERILPHPPRILHLATHARVDRRRPLLSSLVLSGGELLTVGEISSRSLSSRLVVLAGCETARGKVLPGEGVLGFARAFLSSGCPRVVVATRAVPDALTRDFMIEFYAEIQRGRDPSAALSEVRRRWIESEGPRSHSSAWSAFVLWRATP